MSSRLGEDELHHCVLLCCDQHAKGYLWCPFVAGGEPAQTYFMSFRVYRLQAAGKQPLKASKPAVVFQLPPSTTFPVIKRFLAMGTEIRSFSTASRPTLQEYEQAKFLLDQVVLSAHTFLDWENTKATIKEVTVVENSLENAVTAVNGLLTIPNMTEEIQTELQQLRTTIGKLRAEIPAALQRVKQVKPRMRSGRRGKTQS